MKKMKVIITALALCAFASQADVITNALHADSGYMDSTGGTSATYTYAGSVTPTSLVRSAVFIFELPTLSAGESISTAKLEVYLEREDVHAPPSGAGENGDVYAVRVNDALTKLSSDSFYGSDSDGSAGVLKIADNLVTPTSAVGSYNTGDSTTFGSWLAGHYTGVNPNSTYAFLRISVDDVPVGTHDMFRFSEVGDANPAQLIITTVPEPATVGMLGLGGLIVLAARRMRRS